MIGGNASVVQTANAEYGRVMNVRMLFLVMVMILVGCVREGETAVLSPTLSPTTSPTATSSPQPPQVTNLITPTPQQPQVAHPVTPSSPPFPPDINYLAAAVENSLADFDGITSYVIADLENNDTIRHNPDVAIAGMSLLKIPILVETYRVLDAPPNVEQTKLITQTTALSSNYAANLLLQEIAGRPDTFAGAAALTAAMRDLGLFNTFIAVPYDADPRPNQLSTYLTPANQRTDMSTQPDPFRQTTIGDLAALMEWVYDCAQEGNGRLRTAYPDSLTQSECREMLAMLQLNDLVELLEAGLPDNVPIAHKLGYIDDTYGDIGIVFSPERDYLIGVALYRPVYLEWADGSPIFAEISRLTYAHFNDPTAYSPEILAAPPAAGSTSTPAPTPAYPQAIVFGTQGIGLTLRDIPGGSEIAILPEGAVVSLLDDAPTTFNQISWRQVQTVDGLSGWVGADFLVSE